jgi:hypothetical protein
VQPPPWGNEDHLGRLLGGRVTSVEKRPSALLTQSKTADAWFARRLFAV